MGISQLVVKRFGIIKKVFKPGAHMRGERSGVGAQDMLESLLNVLRVSMESAVESQWMPQVSGSAEVVMVSFPSGKKTILHTSLIHATLLLLTCPPPPPPCGDFDFLLDLWFPSGGQFPEAYTVEDKESTPLITREILPEMLYSQTDRVVGLCLRDARVEELCTSIKQFGIPAANMQQILAFFDGLCSDAEEGDAASSLESAVEKPVQLAQFAEVQLIRCGSGDGKRFLSFVRKLGNLPDSPVQSISEMLQSSNTTDEVEMIPVSPSTQEKTNLLQLSEEKVEQVLMKTFAPSVGRSSLTNEEATQLSSLVLTGLKELIQFAAATPNGSKERKDLDTSAGTVFTALHKVVVQCSGRTRRQVLEGMAKSVFTISLLRFLTRICQLQDDTEDATAVELLRPTIKQISDSLATLKFGGKLKNLPRFQAVVKACAKQLGLKTLPERESHAEKIAKVAQGCASAIKREQNVFSAEQAMMVSDIVRLVGTEKQSAHVEDVLSSLVRRSITSGAEGKCIDLLQRLEWRIRPIALQQYPEAFGSVPWSETQGEGREAGASQTTVSTTRPPFVHSLDMSGLKVDLLELLDPEILRDTPEVVRGEVFGWSMLGTEDRPEGISLGPGYLMVRLVHESSWDTLHQVVTSLLEEEQCLNEGLVYRSLLLSLVLHC